MIGTVSYFPGARYAVKRAYPLEIGINAGIYPTDNPTPGLYHLYAPGALPYVLYTFKLHDNFVPWSTTAFTLDHVIEECYYSFPPFTINSPADVSVGFLTKPENGHFYIGFGAFGYTGTPQLFELESAPSNYWMQPYSP